MIEHKLYMNNQMSNTDSGEPLVLYEMIVTRASCSIPVHFLSIAFKFNLIAVTLNLVDCVDLLPSYYAVPGIALY